jgi:hypothetical protein
VPAVVLLRDGPSGAALADALAQEGIGFAEIRPRDLGALGSGAYPDARLLIAPASLGAAEIAHLSRWRAAGGATILIGCDFPEEALLELAGVREQEGSVKGGHLWASSPDFMLPALAPDRPLQITGERRVYAVQARDAMTLALASAPPSAAVTLDANRDGFIDDEWYFCGTSISKVARGRPAVEELILPDLGAFAAQAAAAGDFTGDGFADDLLVASGDTFALRRGGVWSSPRRAPMKIRHALSHPGPGATWAIHLFLGDGSQYVSSFDGGATFSPPSAFAPAGAQIASDFAYSFDYINFQGLRRTGIQVWSGDVFYTNLGPGFGPPSVAPLGPRYLDANIVRPGLGFCSDADRVGLRDQLTLIVGDNLYRLDPTTGSFAYPRSLHREVEVKRTPLVVRRGRTVAFLFDFEHTVKSLQQGRPNRATPKAVKSGLLPGVDPGAGAAIPPVISGFDDWIDYTAWDLPQADLHERLLRQAILGLLETPLPRVWYWPGAARSIASLSHDVETSEPGQEEAVRRCTMDIARRSAALGRKDTFFVLVSPGESALERADIAELTRLGHCVTLHFNTLDSADFSPASLAAQAARLRALGVRRITGNRMHGLAWLGDLVPRALASEPEIFFDGSFGGGPGFSHCGSALPYRVYDEEGEPFTSFDEIAGAFMDVADSKFYFSGIAPPGLLAMTVEELMDRALDLAKKNDEVLYGVLDCSFHPVVVAGLVPPIGPFFDALVAHAERLSKEGIASMTLEQIASWWRLRRGVTIADVRMSRAGRLEFAVHAAEEIVKVTIALPAEWAEASLASVSAAGEPLAWTSQIIDSANVAMIVLPRLSGRIELSARYR